VNKYGSKRTWSNLCNRWFHSRKEAVRGEELRLLEMAGEISDLEYQCRFSLSTSPRITISIDFAYTLDGVRTYEDSKGVLTRDTRTKLAWLRAQRGIEVILS